MKETINECTEKLFAGLKKAYSNLFKNSKLEIDTNKTDIRVINFQVNNYCNSKCVMCNIWREKDYKYIDKDKFAEVLKDDLFKNVEHIGITGGEPLLVNNIVDYFKVAIESVGSLKGLSIITNSLLLEKAKVVIEELNTLSINNGISFSVMLSLDGLNEVHDRNRGINGSFDKVIELANWLKDKNIPFTTGTTVTKINVWNVDKLLMYFKQMNITGRFRVAEFINRLCNDREHNREVIRNFDRDEIYQLLLFFSKLEYNYENDEGVKNTYRSIRNILQGGNRLIECPYKNQKAINVGCHGDIAYCAPKSPIIGNLLSGKGSKIYNKNLQLLSKVKSNYCKNCIHDYHAEPTEELTNRIQVEQKYKKLINVDFYNENKNTLKFNFINDQVEDKTIFIVGWYGTETVGDKAILGGIIDHYKNKYKDIKIYVSSLYPFITERTLYELNVDAVVVPVYCEEFYKYSSISSEVIVGGGPLMELEELALIEWAFKLAKDNHNTTTVYGCGIGPLYSDSKIGAVKEILKLADNIYLRDDKSIEFAKSLGFDDKSLKNIGDPSIKYIKKVSEETKAMKEDKKLSCFLRELTFEYRGNMGYEEFIKFRTAFEKGLADNIIYLCKKTGLKPHFYSMHNFVIGNDDRDFNYRFTNEYFKDLDFYVEDKLSSVEQIISEMKSSDINLSMRFHSVVFADTLDTKFIAVDYTSGGKINSYLTDKNKLNRMVNMSNLINKHDTLYNYIKLNYNGYLK
ncbi:polysaccharide pyruvyl transferase family protein [Clostridium magnum]|uniref:Radical SAM core domain-containing protein n=1 Tax=Clostridium magnum DSM 2767 TaxID=1121326 RepID=A0A161YIK0_9CLOT|nr:polysaccharide pyruvyl transferase family protein [Clostridium magnum]KZL90192.1 hypothetical protein CLMAG_46860 [Clostridium magnum DSM 2767]SHH63975.1 Radical SAM superfamily enzyme, MoaA/NifB/PqqE/SkfB family [Clostridium magnum DSM 2767]